MAVLEMVHMRGDAPTEMCAGLCVLLLVIRLGGIQGPRWTASFMLVHMGGDAPSEMCAALSVLLLVIRLAGIQGPRRTVGFMLVHMGSDPWALVLVCMGGGAPFTAEMCVAQPMLLLEIGSSLLVVGVMLPLLLLLLLIEQV